MTASCRSATPADADAMVALERSLALSPWSVQQFAAACDPDVDAEYALLAEEGGLLLGYVVCRLVLDELAIDNVVVRASAQRRGIARCLLRRALALSPPGVRRCLLEVRAGNVAALGLYRSLGFQEDGRRRNYYPLAYGREDAVLMSLAIAGAHCEHS
jgi:ribosomal-protein-alanine N-acetyltransferase